jgi:hypothetical protein
VRIMRYRRPARRADAHQCAASALAVLVLLLNAVSSALVLAHSGPARTETFASNGKLVLCSYAGTQVLGADAETAPAAPGESQPPPRSCPCCLPMHAGALLAPSAAMPEPAAHGLVQIMHPADARHLQTAPVSAYRNRGPPFPA